VFQPAAIFTDASLVLGFETLDLKTDMSIYVTRMDPKRRSSGKNKSPTFLRHDTNSIENDAFNNSSFRAFSSCCLVTIRG
jgi:hypothetical protein